MRLRRPSGPIFPTDLDALLKRVSRSFYLSLAVLPAPVREQLKAAQRSLSLAAEQVRRLPASADLNDSEVVVLQRLLTSASAADSTDDSGAEAPSLLG